MKPGGTPPGRAGAWGPVVLNLQPWAWASHASGACSTAVAPSWGSLSQSAHAWPSRGDPALLPTFLSSFAAGGPPTALRLGLCLVGVMRAATGLWPCSPEPRPLQLLVVSPGFLCLYADQSVYFPNFLLDCLNLFATFSVLVCFSLPFL